MQEPGGAAEVEACVRAKYHVDFHVFEKVKVNGSTRASKIAPKLTGYRLR